MVSATASMGPEAPGPRARTRQAQHASPHTDAGTMHAPPTNVMVYVPIFPQRRLLIWSRPRDLLHLLRRLSS